MRPDGPRDPYAGPESGPEPPFPIKLYGPVIKGFGRGSKELGIPTANIPPEGLAAYPDLSTGVYYGFVGLSSSSPNSSAAAAAAATVYPSVLSIGYNPFYGNTTRSVEIHILHKFGDDFYGASLNLLILGFIRPEYDYVSKESLIEDIMTDCDVARRSLERPAYSAIVASGSEQEKWLTDFEWAQGQTKEDVEKVQEKVLGGHSNVEESTR